MTLEQRAEQASRLLPLAGLATKLQEAVWSEPVDGLAVPRPELLVGQIAYCTEHFIHFSNCQLTVGGYITTLQLTVVDLSKGLKATELRDSW